MDQCETCRRDREVLDHRIDALEKLIEAKLELVAEKFSARDIAQRIYDQNLEGWKNHANEWRDQLNEERRNFLSKQMGNVLTALVLITAAIQLARLVMGLGV